MSVYKTAKLEKKAGIADMTKRHHSKITASLPASEAELKRRRGIDFSPLKVVNEYTCLFVWVDELEDFFEHSSGLIIRRTLDRSRPRWGKVVVAHPTSSVQVGEYILPEAAHDYFGGVYDGIEVWMT